MILRPLKQSLTMFNQPTSLTYGTGKKGTKHYQMAKFK